MTPYTYSGPQSGVTLSLPGEGELEVQLVNGKEVQLPADHPFVRKLKMKGRLTEAAPDPPAAKPEKSKTPVPVKEASNAG